MDGDELDDLILELPAEPAALMPSDLVQRAIDQLPFDDWQQGRARRAAQSYGERLLEFHLGQRARRPSTRSANLSAERIQAIEDVAGTVAELWEALALMKGVSAHFWLETTREDLLYLRGLHEQPLDTHRLRTSSLAR